MNCCMGVASLVTCNVNYEKRLETILFYVCASMCNGEGEGEVEDCQK